jgi:hypothetical protein
LRRRWFEPNGERAGNGDGEVGLASSGAADQDGIALIGNKAAGSQVPHEALVDRRAGEVELVDVLGQGQFGDGHLVSDGPRLFLSNLGLEQISHDARGLVLALDATGHDLVPAGVCPQNAGGGTAHSVELEAAHQVEDLGAFHVGWSS